MVQVSGLHKNARNVVDTPCTLPCALNDNKGRRQVVVRVPSI